MVPSMVGALLNNIPTLWAVPLAGFIGAVTYNLSTFCASDPPAVPSFTAQDVVDLLNPYNPITYGAAQDKFQDLVGAYAWYQVCKCDSVATPSPPSPPSAPTNMPAINPPSVAPGYPTGQPCQTTQYSIDVVGDNTNHSQADVYLPAGATYVRLTGVFTDMTTPPTPDSSVTIQFLDAANNLYGGYTVGYTGAIHNVHVGQGALLPAYNRFRVTAFGGTGQPTRPFDVSVEIFCGTTPGAGGGPYPTPCPTDPFVLGLLEQILALVTIVQRQAAPFAYVTGAAHPGLTGRGSISVQGLLGAKIEVTSMGSITGEALGDPDVLWDAGWVNWGSADGVSPRQFITAAETLTLPSLAGQYTQLHYSLEQGVTITITELEREP